MTTKDTEPTAEQVMLAKAILKKADEDYIKEQKQHDYIQAKIDVEALLIASQINWLPDSIRASLILCTNQAIERLEQCQQSTTEG